MKHGKSFRQKAVISLIGVLVVAIIISFANILRLFFDFSDGDFFELLISVFEAVGLVFSLFVAIRQLGDSKEIARAQFLTELNKSFVENPDYTRLYNALQDCLDGKCAYRFFLAVHSKFVQEQKIIPQPENFVNIFRLERRWLDYRKKIGKVAKAGSVYATNCLETLVDAQTYASLIGENN